jgi:hypothetical protein
MSRAKVPGMTLVMACPCGKAFMMFRSLKGVVLASLVATLIVCATPALAEPSTGSLATQLWSVILKWITVDFGPAPEPTTTSADEEGGPLIDPNGQDRGANPDPDGISTGGPVEPPNI